MTSKFCIKKIMLFNSQVVKKYLKSETGKEFIVSEELVEFEARNIQLDSEEFEGYFNRPVELDDLFNIYYDICDTLNQGLEVSVVNAIDAEIWKIDGKGYCPIFYVITKIN